MHIGAAEENEQNDGYDHVPIDSFEEEHQVYLRLYRDYKKKKDLEPFQMLFYFFELIGKEELIKIKKVEYSKKFFTKYYFIDAETFNKWVKSFCPELYSANFKKKRKFTQEEANLIFEKLGTNRNTEILPSSRKELIQKILHDSEGKKSKKYEAINQVFDEKIGKYKEFNKLPPIIIKQILFEETRDDNYSENKRDLKLEKEILSAVKFFEYYFPKYSEWEWEIRKRWFSRWINKP